MRPAGGRRTHKTGRTCCLTTEALTATEALADRDLPAAGAARRAARAGRETVHDEAIILG